MAQAPDGSSRQTVRQLLKSVSAKNRVTLRQLQRHAGALKAARFKTGMVRRVFDAHQRERVQLVITVARIRGLMPLLMKQRNGSRWTGAERDELQLQFRALMHLSPYLIVLALPGSFLLLPVLAWWLDRRRSARKTH